MIRVRREGLGIVEGSWSREAWLPTGPRLINPEMAGWLGRFSQKTWPKHFIGRGEGFYFFWPSSTHPEIGGVWHHPFEPEVPITAPSDYWDTAARGRTNNGVWSWIHSSQAQQVLGRARLARLASTLKQHVATGSGLSKDTKAAEREFGWAKHCKPGPRKTDVSFTYHAHRQIAFHKRHGFSYQETAAAAVHEDLQLVGNNWGSPFGLCRDGMPVCTDIVSSDCKHILQASRESSDARAILP